MPLEAVGGGWIMRRIVGGIFSSQRFHLGIEGGCTILIYRFPCSHGGWECSGPGFSISAAGVCLYYIPPFDPLLAQTSIEKNHCTCLSSKP